MFKVLEFAHYRINLSDFINGIETLDKEERIHVIVKIIYQAIKQVNIIHKNGFIHRDLADNNFIIDPKTYELNVIDFGYALKSHRFWRGYTYSRVTNDGLGIAPELDKPSFWGFPYSQQTDIYALGVIFNQMLLSLEFLDIPSEVISLAQAMNSPDPNRRKNLTWYENNFEKLMCEQDKITKLNH